MQITHFNRLGTRESRVVAAYMVDATDERAALDAAVRFAATWNRDEPRRNMRVLFVQAGASVRGVS